MADANFSWDNIPWTRVCPWLTISRAFWIAVDPRKLVLASVALLLLAGGNWVVDQLLLPVDELAAEEFSGEETAGRATHTWPWDQSLGYDLWMTGDPLGEAGLWLTDPRGVTLRVASNWRVVLKPLDFLLVPAEVLGKFPATPTEWIRAAALFAWGVVVWSVFGGAIGRMAAASFARRQTISMRGALWFSITKLPGYLTAPLLPITGIGLMLALVALGGLLGRIPDAGPTIVGVGYGLALALGFGMTVLLVGLAAGWPLMCATINVEGSDGFDGFSRSYNYVFERPWNYLFHVSVCLAYGSVTIFFVWLGSQLVLRMATLGVLAGNGSTATLALLADLPLLYQAEPAALLGVDPLEAGVAGSTGAWLTGLWARGLATLVIAFVHTYFWTATTIIYFLLRRSVDSNGLDEVNLPEETRPDDLLPIVGAAAVPNAPPAPAPAPGGPPVDLTP
jgi:hypothetical protein